ncbi:MAG: hypothetical protein JXA44_05870 [Methanospirillaceae archaeon]|nr:hypothetical protein [Methanospirillaceae archaeon]
MFKRIKEIFGAEKTPESVFELSLHEIPDWLDTRTSACTSKRTTAMQPAKENIERYMREIGPVVDDLGSEGHDEPKHPKVKQVIRHSLPLFKKRIGIQITREFEGDDEEVYRQIAEVVQGCFLALKGPGRYLHQLYPLGIKDFKEIMDAMGRELNVLTRIITVSRQRLGQIEEVRIRYREYTNAIGERKDLLVTLSGIAEKRKETDRVFAEVTKKEEELVQSDPYHCYEELLAEKEQCQENYLATLDRFESACRTTASVCRRASRQYGDAGRGDSQKTIELLENTCIQITRDCHDLKVLIQKSIDLIFALIRSEELILKNAFEKALFLDDDTFFEGLFGACTAMKKAYDEYLHKEEICNQHPVADALFSLHESIEKQRAIKEKIIEEEKFSRERLSHIKDTIKKNESSLITALSVTLGKEPDMIRIPGLYDPKDGCSDTPTETKKEEPGDEDR